MATMKDREQKALEEAFELDNKTISVLLANHNSKMKMIKNDMVTSLDLLDGVAEGNITQKELLRKKILDNYNDLIRENLSLTEELTEILKKE
jgi:hypothetical protein